MCSELVLIVEDNAKNMKLARDVLGFHGFRTAEAGTACEGLRKAAAETPAVILMDIQLPDMRGEEALRRLRAETATAAVPVVAMTAFAMREDRERLLAAGFDAYISKPIDIKGSRSWCEASAASRPRGRARSDRWRRASWWSTTRRRTCACSRPCSARRIT
jgi:CheY-like chemotaxis protein